MTPELQAEITALATVQMEYWRANATEANKEADKAYMAKYEAEPDFGAAEMARWQEAFVAADANGDGVHDINEFKAFTRSNNEKEKAIGHFVDEREEPMDKMFAIANKYNPNNEGVSFEDMSAVINAFMEIFQSMKDQ